MAGPIFIDRVQDTSVTTGLSDFVLSGTPPSTLFQPWSTVGNTNTAYYLATDATDFEVGLGTYSSTGPTLARTTILASSNGGSKVSFAAGTKTISLVEPALLFNGLVTAAASFSPSANDGKALGTGSLSWSDLFLASGGTLNWNNGDVTVTHGTNTLAFAGASSGYSFDAQVTGVTAGAGDNTTKLATTAFVAANSGGMDLLATLTTTSGTTQTATGLPTTYTAFFIVVEGVNIGAQALTLNVSSDNGSTFDTAVPISNRVNLTNGPQATTIWLSGVGDTAPKSALSGWGLGGTDGGATGGGFFTKASPTNALRFAGGTFTAGTIKIYGVK